MFGAYVTQEKSAMAEYMWEAGHRPDWGGVKILDTVSNKNELLAKEAIHMQQTPSKQLINRDNGWQIPEAWSSTLRKEKEQRKSKKKSIETIRERTQRP